MNDSQLKWANCCNLRIECSECEHCCECSNWFRFVDEHRKSKSYAHFDKRTSLANNHTRTEVLNPKWISKHAFWPLIEFEKSKDKFVGAKNGTPAHLNKKEPRVIRYCSHIDRCAYQRYAFLLDQKYNEVVLNRGIDDVAVAYRTNKSHNNLHLVKRALDFIENTNECYILVSDFSSFFDRIDHGILKDALCDLLSLTFLPDDYYVIYKNITGFSSWSWNSIKAYWKMTDPKISRREINSKDIVLPENVFRAQSKKEIKRNWSNQGIPQGSPISAVLSNIYMMGFDEEIQSFVHSLHGLYMRYCDDLLVVLPSNNSDKLALLMKLIDKINNYPGIMIQSEKTSILEYARSQDGATLSLVDIITGQVSNNAVLDYLGITFDGKNRKVRPKAVTKYHYRLNRKAATIARQGKGRRNIYGIYSERAQSISGNRSFVDYVKDANKILDLNDPESASVVNHNMEKIAKAINRASGEIGSTKKK